MESFSPRTLSVPFTLPTAATESTDPPPRDSVPMAGASTNLGRSPANSSSSQQAHAQQARPASSSPSISRPVFSQPPSLPHPKQDLAPAHHITNPSLPGDQDSEAVTLPKPTQPEALQLVDQDSLLRRRKEMADAKDVSKGDEVSYPWGGGQPGGTVTDVATDGAVTMETKNGNEVKKKGDGENPAVYIQRDEGHDVVKKASEIQIEEKKDSGASEDKKEEESKPEENGEAKTGEKRSADDVEDDDAAEDESAKKQKTDDAEPQTNGGPKKKGRPTKGAANGAPKKETKKREPKKAATESGEPRRSGRVASKSS